LSQSQSVPLDEQSHRRLAVVPDDGPDRLDTLDPGHMVRVAPVALGTRYYLDYQIGRGTSGRVWRGRTRDDNAVVAVKVMRDDYGADPDLIARFLRERATLQRLDHPHLVPVHEFLVEGDTLAVVMDLVNGPDLRGLTRNGALNIDESLTILAQVADALAHLHHAGVIHRDIKPENILVTRRDGQPWAQLSDFGLALAAGGQRLTGSSQLIGTPAYLAPELLASRPYGPMIDVYALGVTAHELLAGRRPFEADHPLALMRAHLDDEPRRPDGMDEAHWHLVRICLAKDPRERPTAAELATRLNSLRDQVVASPPAPSSGHALHLTIDFGTANTTAVLGWPDGAAQPLQFDGSPLLPSAVYLDADGAILTGRDALEAARLLPHHCDPYPRLRVDEETLKLGGRDIEVVDLIGAVLRRVASEAHWVAGRSPERVTITHPTEWDAPRLEKLTQAARAARLPPPHLVTEPVATASFLGPAAARQVGVGCIALVYDLGAATFTASAIRRTGEGSFQLLACESLPDVGGIDIEAAILAHVREELFTGSPDEWGRLNRPDTPQDRRAAWQLWADVQQAKEALSHRTTAPVHVPLAGRSVHLGRERFNELARPILAHTVAVARSALAAAGLRDARPDATFLIGGSSRIPLVAALLRQAFGPAPVPIDQPELVVAAGAQDVTQRPARELTHRPAQVPTQPTGPAPPAEPPARRRVTPSMRGRARMPWARRRSRRSILTVALAVPLLTGGIATAPTWFPGLDGAWELPGLSAGPTCGSKIAILGRLNDNRGTGIRDSVRLAVEQYNAEHEGCTVELVEFDTTGSDDNAHLRAREILADRKILGVVGPIHSTEASLSMSWLERDKVVAITPSAPDTNLSQRGWTVFHRMVGSDRDDAVAGARLLTGVLRLSRTFVVDDRSRVSVDTAYEVKRRLGDAVVGSASIDADPATLAATIAKIRASGADSVYYSGFVPTGSVLVTQLRAAQPSVPVVASDRLFTDDLLARAGVAAEGTYVTSPLMPPSNSGRFADTFKARYGMNPPYWGPEAFDAANILLSGLAAGRSTRASMLAWVHDYNGDGVSRHTSFNVDGDLDQPQVWFHRVVNGVFQPGSVIPDV
jgi:ABC-type branched-subunit amino acid transport system substrate-binding protein